MLGVHCKAVFAVNNIQFNVSKTLKFAYGKGKKTTIIPKICVFINLHILFSQLQPHGKYGQIHTAQAVPSKKKEAQQESAETCLL